jgi:2,4-dienoyl-CoA reductase-like NADH-dependent reductase (Old Yellow Enzyme family)
MITKQQGAIHTPRAPFTWAAAQGTNGRFRKYAKLADAVHEHGARMFAQLAG